MKKLLLMLLMLLFVVTGVLAQINFKASQKQVSDTEFDIINQGVTPLG